MKGSVWRFERRLAIVDVVQRLGLAALMTQGTQATQGLPTRLMFYTVCESKQESTMRSAEYRHHYEPKADRVPRWMWRVWCWF
jgi:hypothetical protein